MRALPRSEIVSLNRRLKAVVALCLWHSEALCGLDMAAPETPTGPPSSYDSYRAALSLSLGRGVGMAVAESLIISNFGENYCLI